MTWAPLTADFLKSTRFWCCQFHSSSLVCFSIPVGYGKEMCFTCGAVPHWGCQPRMEELLCFLSHFFFLSYLSYFFFSYEYLWLSLRFVILSPTKSRKQAYELVVSSHHCYNWPERTLQLSEITPLYNRVLTKDHFPSVSCKVIFGQFICIYFALFYLPFSS